LLNSAGIYHRSAKARLSKFAARLFGKLFGANSPLRPFVRRLLGASDYAKASENMKKTLENMLESDKNLDPARVKIPTTIIWGRQDKLTPLWQGRKLAASIPNATFEVVNDWTHNPYRTHPADFAARIATKLKDAA
jgi:pimeloyl-ACP methyl ester carboxylesterase